MKRRPMISEPDRSWLLELAALALCTVALVGAITLVVLR